MKYRVVHKCIEYLYIDVEADSIEEAKEIADNTDGGNFTYDFAYWEYDKVLDKNGNVLECS